MFPWWRIEILVTFPNKFVSDLLMLIAKKLTELGGHSAMKNMWHYYYYFLSIIKRISYPCLWRRKNFTKTSYNMLSFASSLKNDDYWKVNFRSLTKSVNSGITSFELLHHFLNIFICGKAKFKSVIRSIKCWKENVTHQSLISELFLWHYITIHVLQLTNKIFQN